MTGVAWSKLLELPNSGGRVLLGQSSQRGIGLGFRVESLRNRDRLNVLLVLANLVKRLSDCHGVILCAVVAGIRPVRCYDNAINRCCATTSFWAFSVGAKVPGR